MPTGIWPVSYTSVSTVFPAVAPPPCEMRWRYRRVTGLNRGLWMFVLHLEDRMHASLLHELRNNHQLSNQAARFSPPCAMTLSWLRSI